MPNFNIVKENTVEETFRVSSVMGMFDLQTNKVKEEFNGSIDIENKDWNIGVIVGASGTGKTTIAKELFGDKFINHQYKSTSVIDDMPEGKTVKEITKAFNSVGFSSPPSWLKPYDVLSNGEKMRVDLAYSILKSEETIIFDEFTSVVDRNVAQIGSHALQKTVRKQGKRFIAVACHYDILDWLEPDWVFNTDEMGFFLPRQAQKAES